MLNSRIPVKTVDGHLELVKRERRLGQRQRTVLLLVDGKRSEHEVRLLAQQAGAGDGCFAELLALGLIALPQPPAALDATVPMARPLQHDETPLHVDIPLGDLEAPPPAAPGDAPESLLPAARTLQPESVLGDSVLGQSLSRDFDALEAAPPDDAPLEEARGILIRAVRSEAPLSGSLTLLRLRRARTRNDLAELIDEVEARIVKPYRSLAAQQTLRRARHLLATHGDGPSAA